MYATFYFTPEGSWGFTAIAARKDWWRQNQGSPRTWSMWYAYTGVGNSSTSGNTPYMAGRAEWL